MTPEKAIQQLIDEGKLINLTLKDQSAIKIYDAEVNGEVRPIFQTVSYSSELDVTVNIYCSVDLVTARQYGEYLISLADKYENNDAVVAEEKVEGDIDE